MLALDYGSARTGVAVSDPTGMVCRLSPMFDTSPTAMHVVTWVGAITCFFAATVGCAQNDIKRVIAYSTCSQLGYMFFAAGVGAYGAAMFHLFTHAFFKALLFLGAGSVIHAMHHEQDMDEPAEPYARVNQPLQGALILLFALFVSPLGYLLIGPISVLTDRAAGSLF